MATAIYDVVVVGGGIVGAACAFTLRRDGLAVLLIDRGEPERAASWGNAGHFAYEQIFPLASMGLWRQLPRLLLARQSPLRIPLASLVTQCPWLLRFLWNTRPAQMHRATAGLASLLELAPDAWRRLAAAADLHALIRAGPVLVVAQDTAGLAAKRPVMAELRRHGIRVDELELAAARAIEPMLRPDVAGAFIYPDAQHAIDPAGLTAKLGAAYVKAGGVVTTDDVRSVGISADGIVSVTGPAATRMARQCIVAAGIGSRDILRSFAIRVPLTAERGYHLMIPYLQGRPAARVPIIGARPEFVITPMAKGLRLAGTVEIARPGARPDWIRATMLKKLAERIIGPLDSTSATMWMGCRPTLPDSLPVIGRIPGAPEIIGAFGHQHLGLTLAAITAELVSCLARRARPSIEIGPYSLARF